MIIENIVILTEDNIAIRRLYCLLSQSLTRLSISSSVMNSLSQFQGFLNHVSRSLSIMVVLLIMYQGSTNLKSSLPSSSLLSGFFSIKVPHTSSSIK